MITDHHLPPSTLPTAVAVVDPRRQDDHSPFKELCGAGVAFKLCAALEDCMPEELLEFCSDLAAIGTVADVMPLTGENRTIVKAGLQILQNTQRPGLAALLKEVGLAGKTVTADNVSFGSHPGSTPPAGMDSAASALQLVLCEDPDRACCLARHLNEINAQRQETEQKIEKAVEEMLAAEPQRTQDRVMLLWGAGWHQGVIGIVASRLVEKFGRPVMVVSIAENGEAKGQRPQRAGVQPPRLHHRLLRPADPVWRPRHGRRPAGAGGKPARAAPPDERVGRPGMPGDPGTPAGVRPVPPAVPCDGGGGPGGGADGPLWGRQPRPGVFAGTGHRGGDLPGVRRQAQPPAAPSGQRQPLRRLVRDAAPAGALPDGGCGGRSLSLSVYEGARGAQISGRILDLHPAGLGPDAARQAALVDALKRGASLSPEERQLVCPSREEVAAVYRELKTRRWHADDLQPLCARMGTASTGKTLVAVEALRQVGLVAEAERDGASLSGTGAGGRQEKTWPTRRF